MASWKQNPVVAITAVVILVGAIILGVVLSGSPKVNYSLKCESCNTEFQAKLAKDTLFPVKCISCGKEAAYELKKFKCKVCGNIFDRLNKPIAFSTSVNSKENLAERASKAPIGADPLALRCPKCGAVGQVEEVK